MSFPDIIFNEEKATQVAAKLLFCNNGKLPVMKLVKLLYFCDKEALRKWNYPIIGDVYFSMKNGPVPSGSYDLIKNGGSIWNDYITFNHSNEVSLKTVSPSYSSLSEAEVELIEGIDNEYKTLTGKDLSVYSHDKKYFPEWKKMDSGRSKIELENILDGLGKSESEKRFTKNEVLRECQLKECGII